MVAVFVAVLALAAPAQAAVVIGGNGKAVQRWVGPNLLIGEANDGTCKFPPGNRVVSFHLAHETKLVDAIAWISSVICKPFLLPGTIDIDRKRLTLVAPERMTAENAYRFFLGALDSVGLTVEPSGRFLQIVEVRR